MAKYGKRTVRGSILSTKGGSGLKYLQLQPYKADELLKAGKIKSKRFGIGLEDTKANRKIAFEMLEVLEQEAKNLTPNSYEVKRLPSIFEAWAEFEKYKKPLVSKDTFYSYHLAFKEVYLKDFIIDKHSISQYNNIKSFYAEEIFEIYVENHKTERKINNRVRNIAVFFNWCKSKGYLPPLDIRKYLQKLTKYEVLAYSKEELEMILEVLKKEKYEIYLWFVFLLETGSRRRESIKLMWSDVDMDNQTLSFPNKINKHIFQKIPISAICKKILLELKEFSELRLGDAKKRVFPWTYEEYLTRTITNIQKELGIYKRGRSVHATRKTFATRLINGNVEMYAVQDLMRHSSIETTRELYAQKEYDSRRAILDNLKW